MIGLDTSVAVPLLVQTHPHHASVTRWWDGRDVSPCGHALVETYSVLTRLPGDLRLTPDDAAALLTARFPVALPLSEPTSLPSALSRLGVAGGAVYDALVALAAAHHDVPLATRDARARATYAAVGVDVLVLPDLA